MLHQNLRISRVPKMKLAPLLYCKSIFLLQYELPGKVSIKIVFPDWGELRRGLFSNAAPESLRAKNYKLLESVGLKSKCWNAHLSGNNLFQQKDPEKPKDRWGVSWCWVSECSVRIKTIQVRHEIMHTSFFIPSPSSLDQYLTALCIGSWSPHWNI